MVAMVFFIVVVCFCFSGNPFPIGMNILSDCFLGCKYTLYNVLAAGMLLFIAVLECKGTYSQLNFSGNVQVVLSLGGYNHQYVM